MARINNRAIQIAIANGTPLVGTTGLPAAEEASNHASGSGIWDDRIRSTTMWMVRVGITVGPAIMAAMPAWRHGALDHTGLQTDYGIAEAVLLQAGLYGLWLASVRLVPALRL